jgi:hypothetical protein
VSVAVNLAVNLAFNGDGRDAKRPSQPSSLRG